MSGIWLIADKPVTLPTIDVEIKSIKDKDGNVKDIRVKKDFGGLKKAVPDTMELHVPISPTFKPNFKTKDAKDEYLQIKVIIEKMEVIEEKEPIKELPIEKPIKK